MGASKSIQGVQLIDDNGDLIATEAISSEAKLELVRALLATIDADTSILAAVDFATQTTLAALLTNSVDIETILTAIRDTAGIKKITDALPAGTNLLGNLKLEDGAGSGRVVGVDSSNRILVATSPPITPPAATAVNITSRSSISAQVDTFHTITNTKILTIQQFRGGSEGGSTGDRQSGIELFEDPNGDLSVLNLISVKYISGSNFTEDLERDFVGNGTRRILLRRFPFDSGAREVAGFWDGFEL